MKNKHEKIRRRFAFGIQREANIKFSSAPLNASIDTEVIEIQGERSPNHWHPSRIQPKRLEIVKNPGGPS